MLMVRELSGKLWEIGGYFNFKADCQQLLLFFVLYYFIYYIIAPQGDVLQQGTEMPDCIALCLFGGCW